MYTTATARETSAGKQVIAQISQLFLLFLRFRRRCLQHILSKLQGTELGIANSVGLPEVGGERAFSSLPHSPERPSSLAGTLDAATIPITSDTPSRTQGTLPGQSMPTSTGLMQMDREQVMETLQRVELNIATLTGIYVHEQDSEGGFSPLKQKSKSPPVFELPVDSTSLEEYETILSEHLGISLPWCDLENTTTDCTYCTGLFTTQCAVESALLHTRAHFILEESIVNAPPPTAKPLASSQALRELQQTLYQELWQDTAPENLHDAPPSGSDGQDGSFILRSSNLHHTVPPPSIHVVEEVNTLMHTQRVAQCTQYLEVLNDKATRRKKMIRSLMNLWQAAKATIEDRGGIPKFAGDAEIQRKRLQAMPTDEILTQTKSLQQLLVHDMQEPEGTKQHQVTNFTILYSHSLICIDFIRCLCINLLAESAYQPAPPRSRQREHSRCRPGDRHHPSGNSVSGERPAAGEHRCDAVS